MTVTRSVFTACAPLAAALLLAACGGGGGGGTSVPPVTVGPGGGATPAPSTAPSPLPSATPSASAQFSIAVPASIATSSDRRHPRYVSPNTHAIAITLNAVNGKVTGAAPVVTRVGYGLPGCTAQAGSALTCTASMAVPAQAYDTFTVAAYASPDGSGPALSTTTVTQTFTPNQSSTVAFTLGGIVDSIAMSPAVIHTVQGSGTAAFLVSLTARDASGAVILGTTPFQSPVSIAVQNDPGHAVSLGQETVAAPGMPIQVHYDGSKTLADGQVVASAGSLGNATTHVIPLSFTPTSVTAQMGDAPTQIAVSEVGFTGGFTASSDFPSVASSTVHSTGAGTATIDVTPAPLGGSAGFASVTISDGARSTSIRVTVSAPTLAPITYVTLNSPNFRPTWMTLAPSGKIYTTSTSNAIDEFDPQTQTLQTYSFRSMASGNPRGLASDAAGNIWFGGFFFPSKICEMLIADHSFACYNQGLQAGSSAFGLALGPDNAIWFCDGSFGSPAIGRIDPITHVITEYTAGLLSTASLSDIVAGNDGNMYFSDVGVPAAFGSISTTTHQIAEYTDGIAQFDPQTQHRGTPYQIALGSDGNIWAADGGAPAIDKFIIAQHTTVQYFNGIQRNGNPIAITSSPSGDLWFTDSGLFAPDLLGNVKVGSGAVQEYGGFPSNATDGVRGIVATSAHDLWFFDQQAQAMGHITTP